LIRSLVDAVIGLSSSFVYLVYLVYLVCLVSPVSRLRSSVDFLLPLITGHCLSGPGTLDPCPCLYGRTISIKCGPGSARALR